VSQKMRVIIADDERPARSFLAALLRGYDDIELIGEAAHGAEAIELIETLRPDLALLDLQMPEVTGLDVIRLLPKRHVPLVIFATAHDEFAVQAFQLNAVDYLLKPVEAARLREALTRAQDRLERAEWREAAVTNVQAAVESYDEAAPQAKLERIPIRQRDEIVIVAVSELASIVSEGELLHLTTANNEKYTMTYRLKDLEARLDPTQFVRLARGTLANVNMIRRVSPLPGGNYLVTLSNGTQLNASRIQSRILREQLWRL
jgi:two-component system, LytTR family, response regulator